MNMDFPKKDLKRAERRKDKSRKYMKAKCVAEAIFGPYADKDKCEYWAKRNADNLKSCGCSMCRNPRREFKEDTFQEKKFKEYFFRDSMECD